MKKRFMTHALGMVAASALVFTGGIAQAKDSITIAVPSFLTGGAAGPFGIPAMNGAKMVADAINKGTLTFNDIKVKLLCKCFMIMMQT